MVLTYQGLVWYDNYMKTWWDILIEKRPGLVKYPASIAKPTVLRAEQGDQKAIDLLKQWHLWDTIIKESQDTSK